MQENTDTSTGTQEQLGTLIAPDRQTSGVDVAGERTLFVNSVLYAYGSDNVQYCEFRFGSKDRQVFQEAGVPPFVTRIPN